jgi:hypothetical protein
MTSMFDSTTASPKRPNFLRYCCLDLLVEVLAVDAGVPQERRHGEERAQEGVALHAQLQLGRSVAAGRWRSPAA